MAIYTRPPNLVLNTSKTMLCDTLGKFGIRFEPMPDLVPRDSPNIKVCPFDHRVGICLETNTVFVDETFELQNPNNFSVLIHECAHLVAGRNLDEPEIFFLGWEYLVAKHVHFEQQWIEELTTAGQEFLIDDPRISQDNKKQLTVLGPSTVNKNIFCTNHVAKEDLTRFIKCIVHIGTDYGNIQYGQPTCVR